MAPERLQRNVRNISGLEMCSKDTDAPDWKN